MVHLRGVVSVSDQEVVVDSIFIAVQILQERRNSLFSTVTDGFCPAAIFWSEQRCPESFLLLYSAARELCLTVSLAELFTLDTLYDSFDYPIENKCA